MIEVQVRWFAAYREATGIEAETVETRAATPAELFDSLKQKHPSLASRNSALVAINDEMAGWDQRLNAGDTILFFPPVAGG